MLRRAAGGAPADLAGSRRAVDIRAVLAAAERAAGRDLRDTRALRRLAEDDEPAVRWWAATGFLVRGAEAVRAGRGVLGKLMRTDASPSVRIAAAEAVAHWGEPDERAAAAEVLLAAADATRSEYFDAVAALNAIDELPELFAPHRDRLEALPREKPGTDARMRDYLERLVTSAMQRTLSEGGRR